MAKKEQCPQCGSNVIIPIIYGMPSSVLGVCAEQNGFELGGCLVRENDPQWKCKQCGIKW